MDDADTDKCDMDILERIDTQYIKARISDYAEVTTAVILSSEIL